MKLATGKAWWVFSFLLVFMPFSVLAQSGEMEEVVVSGKSIEGELTAELAQYGNQVDIVTREEIENAGVNDLGQALEKLVPGVHVTSNFGRNTDINISLQGGRNRDVLVLLDGVRLSDRTWGGKFIIRLDSINPHLIERIEVIKGGQALFYGTRAIAGVINIVTKPIQSPKEGEAGFAVGELDDRVAYADVSDKWGKWDVMFFGNHNQGAFQPFKNDDIETTASGNKNEHNVTNIGLKLERQFGEDRTLRIFYQKNDSRNDRLGADGRCFDCFNEREEDVLSLKWDQKLTDQTKLFVKGYYHNWDSLWTQIDKNDTGDLVEVTDEGPWYYEDYGLTVMGKHREEDGSEWMGGLDYQAFSGSDFSIRLADAEEEVGAAFLQYRPVLDFSPKTNISVGARHTAPDRAEDKTVWNVSAKHPLHKSTSFRFNVGTSYRIPSFMELFAENLPAVAQFPRVGNPNLEPEEGFNVNLGFTGSHELSGIPIQWQADYFYRDIDDLIQKRTTGPDTGLFENTDATVESRGFDVKVGAQLTREWLLQGNYVLSDVTEEGSSTQLDKIPEDFFKGILKYDDSSGYWGGQFTGLWTGEIRKSFIVNDPTFGNYFVGDLSAYIEPSQFIDSRLTLTVENIFDEEYASDIQNGTRVGGGDFRIERLGLPRNVQLEYRVKF